jgi:hypothetical protein
MVSRRVEGNVDMCRQLVRASKALSESISEGAKFRCSGMLTKHVIQQPIRKKPLYAIRYEHSERGYGANNKRCYPVALKRIFTIKKRSLAKGKRY